MTSFRRFRGSELAEYYSYDAQELTNLAKAVNSGVYLRAELGTIGLYLGAYKGRPLWMYVPLGKEAETVYLQVHDGVTSVSSTDFLPDQPAPVLSASSVTSSSMTGRSLPRGEDGHLRKRRRAPGAAAGQEHSEAVGTPTGGEDADDEYSMPSRVFNWESGQWEAQS